MANKTMSSLEFSMSDDVYEITDEAARTDISALKALTINGKPLSENINLSAFDVGAASSEHTHTASDLNAAPVDHTHTAAEVGAATVDHTHAPTDIGAADDDHTHTAKEIGALPVIDASNIDMNSILESGVHAELYIANSTTSNTPYTAGVTVGYTSFGILSFGSSANHGMQIAFSAGYDKICYRTRSNGTNSEWKTLIDSESIVYSENQPTYVAGRLWLKPLK